MEIGVTSTKFKSSTLLNNFIYAAAISILCFSTLSFAANYYVDKNASGSNSGTSWTNAWESFSAINWSIINSGDVLFISGGTVNEQYSEQLDIPAGTNGVVITKGTDSGHNGEVIIDGNGTRGYGIYMNGQSSAIYNILIQNLTIRNCTWAGIYGTGENSGGLHDITVNSCTLYDNLRSQIFFEGGGNVTNNYNLIIQNSYLKAPNTYGSQTDLIYCQYTNDITVDHNILIDDNTSLASSDLHDDNIQCFNVNNVVYSFNIASKQSNKTYGTQMYFVEAGTGTVKIYGNVGFNNSPLQKDATIRIKNRSSGTYIYDNSIFNANDQCVNTDDPTTKIYNNIFESLGTSYHYVMVQYANRTSGESNYNLYYDPSNVFTLVSGGTGNNDIEANPLFKNLIDISSFDLSLLPSSPAIDAGTDLGSPYNIDLAGISRPQGNGWDIGAYEYASGPDTTAPRLTGANLLNATTLKLNFSEYLQQSSAENINNYSITNGISVLNASLSGSQVTLSTSEHTESGPYTVSVTNVKDLAGNLISSEAHTAQYDYNPGGELVKFNVDTAYAPSVPEPNHSAAKAIDGLGYDSGDPDTRWADRPMPEWIVFDLGSVKSVARTRLSFFNFNNGRIYHFNIEVSTDSINWDLVLQNVQSSSNEWTVNDFNTVQAKYIKVTCISSNQNEWAGLWEGEIWGYENSPTNTNQLKNQIENFQLFQNYPNPFNPTTTIKFYLPASQNVLLSVYNSIGQLVQNILNDYQTAGNHEVPFDGRNLSSGVYFYKIETPSFREIKKMILMK